MLQKQRDDLKDRLAKIRSKKNPPKLDKVVEDRQAELWDSKLVSFHFFHLTTNVSMCFISYYLEIFIFYILYKCIYNDERLFY